MRVPISFSSHIHSFAYTAAPRWRVSNLTNWTLPDCRVRESMTDWRRDGWMTASQHNRLEFLQPLKRSMFNGISFIPNRNTNLQKLIYSIHISKIYSNVKFEKDNQIHYVTWKSLPVSQLFWFSRRYVKNSRPIVFEERWEEGSEGQGSRVEEIDASLNSNSHLRSPIT